MVVPTPYSRACPVAYVTRGACPVAYATRRAYPVAYATRLAALRLARFRLPTRLVTVLLAFAMLTAASGCMDDEFHVPDGLVFWSKPDPKIDYTTPEDAFVLRGGQMVADLGVKSLGGDFEGARLLFQQKEYEKAAEIFGKIADHKKNIMQVAEAARYYQAESFYKLGKYPKAGDYYIKLLNDFPSAAHGDEARKRLFDIANYWLDETRDQMEQAKEAREGKRWYTPWIQPVHFEDSKPLLDIEGHSLKYLEAVYMTNPRGPLGEKALFYLGSIKFYRESYKDAENYFYQLVLNYPNGVHAPKALQMAIICKEIDTGGPDYDGRRLQEARDMIEMAKRTYPELQRGQEDFLAKQVVEIHNLQAQKDFNEACFWERIGHPGSAHFLYEIVTRRYPGTPWAEKAQKKLIELRASAAREASRPQPAAQQEAGLPDRGSSPQPFTPGQPLTAPAGIGPAPQLLPQGFGGPR